MAVIKTFGLSRNFGDIVAVEDLNLEVEQGEVLGFLGPNGAGKTTTIRMLAGIIKPTRGHAIVAGFRTDYEVERLHQVIGLLTEVPGFYHRLSARRNLEFFGNFYPDSDAQAQAEKYLRLMGLWERRHDKVGTFSKGMKQRLALARVLLHEPQVLFLDEPTAGLDPEASREVREFIKSLSQQGRTIFLSTHNLAEAESICHRVALFRRQMLAVDTPENLRQRLFQRQMVVQMDSVEDSVIAAVRKLNFVQSVRREGSSLTVELADFERNRPNLVECIVMAGGRIQQVFETEHSLEDIYLTLVREETEDSSANRKD